MFHVLLESAGQRPRRGRWTLTSAVVHATLLTAAVVLTIREPSVTTAPVEIVDLVLPRVPMKPPSPTTALPRMSTPGSLAFQEIQVAVPAVPITSFIPNRLPLTGETLTDPSLIGDRFVPRTIAGDSVYEGNRVDRQVMPRRDNASPDYPQSLRAATVEGNVLVQFVVDSAGRVELNSIQVLRATHALFAESTRRWLARTRYHPAEILGRPVRQLVQQEIAFTLDR